MPASGREQLCVGPCLCSPATLCHWEPSVGGALRWRAAAWAESFHGVTWRDFTHAKADGGYRTAMRQSGVVRGEFWTGVILFWPGPLHQLLAECFPVCLSIIRASSGRPLSHYALHLWSKCLLEMSHHGGWWESRCYYQSAIHSLPDRH